jgi:hypothetical protein
LSSLIKPINSPAVDRRQVKLDVLFTIVKIVFYAHVVGILHICHTRAICRFECSSYNTHTASHERVRPCICLRWRYHHPEKLPQAD